MKKYLTTIIAVAVIAVILAGFFIVKKIGLLDPAPEPTDPNDNVETGAVFAFFGESETAFSDVVRIDSMSGGSVLSLEKVGGEWVSVSHPNLNIISKNVTSKMTAMRSLNGRVAYKGEITESKRYEFGFQDSEYMITLTSSDGTAHRIIFGKDNQDGGSAYVWEEGRSVVYLVGTYSRTSALITATDLLSSSVFTFDDNGQIGRISVSKNGEKYLQLQAVFSAEEGASRTWLVKYPLERAGDTTAIESLVTSLTSMTLASIEQLAAEDLSKYGLAPAKYRVAVTDPHKTVTLSVGDSTPDRSGYYVSIDDGSDVYVVSSTYVTFTDTSVLSYMDKYIFMVSYAKLVRVDLKVLGREYVLTYNVPENVDDEQFLINGMDVNIDGNDCRSVFKRIGTAMYGLRLNGLEDEPAERGELLASIRYEEGDGTVTLVECFRRDDTTMYYYLNGEYVGGYGNQYLLTSSNTDYGILGTVDNLYEAMNLSDPQAG